MMYRWNLVIGLVLQLGWAGSVHTQDGKKVGPISPPTYRIVVDGFEAGEADIRALLDSASRELWKYFPDYTIEPMVVTRGRSGPITLYQRNEKGEIVIRLDTGKTYWAQYSYQFAHEFCHVLCRFQNSGHTNLWFEETVCETASLFTMRAMARTWKTSPPYANWKDYRDSLRGYVDDILRKRVQVYEIYEKGLPAFYRAHKTQLEKDSGVRDLNGAMSIVLLQLFEEKPERWEAVRWLNSSPAPQAETFAAYLQRWHDAAPAKHQSFVKKIADLYGVAIRSDTPAGLD